MPLVAAGTDRTEARRLQRLAAQGRLRRIYPGVYSDDLLEPLESIVRRELYALSAAVAPGAILSHRSALDSRRWTEAGSVFLTGPYRRDIELPGLTLRIVRGPGPLPTDIRVPTFCGDTHIASHARALLENLTQSRGAPAERRTLGAGGVEAWLERFISRDVRGAVGPLRDSARASAEPLGLQQEFGRLDAMIGALLGTRAAYLSTRAGLARAAGRPYDGARIELFETLAGELQRDPLAVPDAAAEGDPHLQAFIETYFSNYIEGTEFELEEAHEIVVRGRPLAYREDDSHDILGTYQAILKSKADPGIPRTFAAFAALLQEWNRGVIATRSGRNPGEFKIKPNRAGTTLFVAPELVVGTLERGFEVIMSAATPENRSALAMFIVAEVHPFADGNGRTARLAMNLFLSAAGRTRIVVPTVYRDDYISVLKALSLNAHPVPLVRMLARAARFSRWLNLGSKVAAFAALRESNALERPERAQLTFGDS